MGLLVNGVWHDQWYETKESGGKFVRDEARFRNWIKPEGDFRATNNRYHLYVSLACPWAHRTLIVRALKGLETLIDISVVDALMLSEGWQFSGEGEPLFSYKRLHQIYTRAKTDYSGRVTVPVLWDKQSNTIVSNESSEIIRMFNSAFDGITGNTLDLWPETMRDDIEEVNTLVYDAVNNGVYRCGFATSQEAYEEAYDLLFATLDTLEQRLATQRYLLGPRPTEADIRLFTTLIRFDPVYVGHFKCNRQRLADYPNLWNYMLEIYVWPGVAATVNMQHIKSHYYGSHETINPTRIVPKGPHLRLEQAHDRDRLPGLSLADCSPR